MNCSDPTQPGVARSWTSCDAQHQEQLRAGKYYLVNNYGLGYDMDGQAAADRRRTTTTLPPQTVPTIAEALAHKGVSWKWYTGGREPADVTADAAAFGVPVAVAQGAQYNTIGDPLVASSNVQGSASLKAGLAGLTTTVRGHRRQHAAGGLVRRARRTSTAATPATRRRPSTRCSCRT